MSHSTPAPRDSDDASWHARTCRTTWPDRRRPTTRSPLSRSASGSSRRAVSGGTAWRWWAASSSGSWSSSRSSGPCCGLPTPWTSPGRAGRAGLADAAARLRDGLARARRVRLVVHGARLSVFGPRHVVIAGVVGVTVGVVAGFFGGRVDGVLMRLVDVMFAIPFLFVILVAASFFGGGDTFMMMLIFGLLSWPLIARLTRASFLSLREQEFVDAARAVGVLEPAHRLPAHPAQRPRAGRRVRDACGGLAIILEGRSSAISGSACAPPTQLGQVAVGLAGALRLGNWWWAFFPGLAIALMVIAISFIGDGLRDAFDPRARE